MRWLSFFLAGWGLPLMVYVALQTGVLLCVRGRWRIAAASPLPFMAVVLGHMLWAFFEGNRLWPFMMLLATPGASLAIVVVWLLELSISRRVRSFLVLLSIGAAAVSAAALSRMGLRILWSGPWTVATAATLLSLGAVVSQLSNRPTLGRPRGPRDP